MKTRISKEYKQCINLLVRVLKPAIEQCAGKRYNDGAREILSDATSYYQSNEGINQFGYSIVPLVQIKRNNVQEDSDDGSVFINLDNSTSIYLSQLSRNAYCSGYHLTINGKIRDDLRNESDVSGSILLGMFLAYLIYLQVDMELLGMIKAGYNLKLAPSEIVVLVFDKAIRTNSNDDLGWLSSSVEFKSNTSLTFILKREGLSTSSNAGKSISKHDLEREIEIGSITERKAESKGLGNR